MMSSIRVDCPVCGKQGGVRFGREVVKKVGIEKYGLTWVQCACGARTYAQDLVPRGNFCARMLAAS